MVKAVVFDIGNVLIQWRPERHYDSLMPRARREAMFAETDLAAMNDRIDLGAPFRETVYAWAEKYPRWRQEIRLWHDDWLKMASPEIPQSVALLAALKVKGVPVFALTNFGIGTFEIARKAYPFLDSFDRAFVSAQMHLAKPDPEIYARLEQETGFAGEDLLFADDRADNIDAARARGWKALRFSLDSDQGARDWAHRLVAEGVLSAQEAEETAVTAV